MLHPDYEYDASGGKEGGPEAALSRSISSQSHRLHPGRLSPMPKAPLRAVRSAQGQAISPLTSCLPHALPATHLRIPTAPCVMSRTLPPPPPLNPAPLLTPSHLGHPFALRTPSTTGKAHQSRVTTSAPRHELRDAPLN